MVSEGVYRGRVTRWGLGKARTGTYQLEMSVDVIEEAKDQDDLAAGYKPLTKVLKRTLFMPITAGTKAFVLADLAFIGFDKKTLASAYLIPGTPASFDFAGKEFPVQCKHDEYNGKTNEKWRICRRKETASGMAREDISQFDSLFANDEDEGNSDSIPL